ncbi:aspartate racemase [Ruegeria sp. ANG-R]|uniref:aspartate/glutamate racemase family protein n=1 Tax=Ruegeria sp. ANG-R TaxID=1577903 RepID=UPI00057D12E6|nr:amino acid racemase [Ruegeria sp. ANG-R]KIC37077.1 aspartate racemase [Ruegeria sp. ANG-R]
MKPRVTGILGGMGPEATILLQQRVLATVQATDDADHLPLLIDMNPQVPSRIAHLIDGTGADPGPVLADMARKLEQSGASALAMPCNTAHHYAVQIEQAVAIPFLNMVNLSVEKAANDLPSSSRVGILSSPALRKVGVFDAPLKRVGFAALWPKNEDKMLGAIRRIKADGPTDETLEVLSSAAEELSNRGAELLFVACSEFSLLTRDLPQTVPIIDTVDVLADAIHTHSLTR